MEPRFAALGKKIFLYEADRKTKVRQLLWGDFLNVEAEEPDGWLKVVWAPKSPTHRRELFIPKGDTIETRPMEIVFVDVGQGDGAVLITPETGQRERIVVIDAGQGDNMERFLGARFRTFRGFNFDSAVLTHPDKDHYNGFRAIFENQKIGFDTVYQSGLVERPTGKSFETLGGLTRDPDLGRSYLTQLAEDDTVIEEHFSDPSTFGSRNFPPVMHAALTNPKIKKFRMLSTEHGKQQAGKSYMPDFAPVNQRGYTIEVLGPVVERDAQGKPRLRRLDSYGETKNGHSVLLKLVFGNFSVLFGGDLNVPAEKFLLTHYAGLSRFPKEGSDAYQAMIAKARETFHCDVMKCCHHGSEKVTDAFLEAVNPACFVISSGDREGHVHPRPDLLGRLGRFGRGKAPVLLSTELQRSTREKEDKKAVERLQRDIKKLAESPTDARRKSIEERVKELAKTNVDVYGAIYLKTDGERLITAFKIETGSQKKKWFYFEYCLGEHGELELVE